MLFNSTIYIFVFLPVVLAVYYFINHYRLIVAGKTWLVFTSLFFYAYWNKAYLLIIIISMLVNYAVGTALHNENKNQKSDKHKRKVILCVGIVFNLGLLIFYKYTDFLITNVNILFGTQFHLFHLLLPLAISFFTFQQIAFLMDCYQKDTQEYDFINYCLFVTFFPQLIAGPIVHHQEMMPQFINLRNKKFNYTNLALGIFVFSCGLFKKVFIADQFAIWANSGFDNNTVLNLVEAWITCLSYTFQLYFDFSGYSDMAIGAALFFNIRLPVNFNSPYKSLNIIDFWRRWHMTLSRWFKDYFYIPLGGSRKGYKRTYLNLFFTFVLVGIWHGSGWTFVVWGVLHGTAIVVNRLWQQKGKQLPVFLAGFVTFMFVNLGWVFFRAESFNDVLRVLGGMLGLRGIMMPGEYSVFLSSLFSGDAFRLNITEWFMLMSEDTLLFMLTSGLIIFFLPNTMQISGFLDRKMTSYRSVALNFQPTIFWALVSGAFFVISVHKILSVQASEFLYFNF